MAKKQPPIRVEAFVKIGGEEVNIDSLSPEKRKEVATALKLKWMNELFRGKAVFYTEDTAPEGAEQI